MRLIFTYFILLSQVLHSQDSSGLKTFNPDEFEYGAYIENEFFDDKIEFQEQNTLGGLTGKFKNRFPDNFNLNTSVNQNIDYPIEIQIELNLIDFRDVDIKSDYFYSKFLYHLNSNSNNSHLNLEDFVKLHHDESERTKEGNSEYNKRLYPLFDDDSIIVYSQYFQAELPHRWNLRDYPFDKQYFKIIFEATHDTSVVKLNPSIEFPPQLIDSKFPFLYEGFRVNNLLVKSDLKKSPYKIKEETGDRFQILEQLIFLVEVDREGSFLYFKLFFGAFLSFIISFLVFFITPNFFDTRITLSVGGIFGAIGNKYFVETTMPALQVLTKADIINNFTILFIIMNIFIVIAQQSKNINMGLFENNRIAAILMMFIYLISNFIVVII